MKIVEYPHPTLRHKSKPLKKIDADLRRTVAEMFHLMYEAEGIGLAANQVDLPYRLFVLNLSEERTQEDEMVFINPVISRGKEPDEKEEGCLSIPGVYASVRRPTSIHVSALDLTGRPIEVDCRGLLARAIQHETDHLDGILFIDRLVETTQKEVQDDLDRFIRKFKQDREENNIPPDDTILHRLEKIESTYCR